MKRFNVSILAVVAILAIGLTAFTKADSASKRVLRENCYTQLTTICEASPITLITNSSTCTAAQARLNVAVSLPTTFVEEIDCVVSTADFCCAQLEKINSPLCATQPLIDFVDFNGVPQTNSYAKIHAVFCRP